jgi:Spy/CpxP family protein refolding chaperone
MKGQVLKHSAAIVLILASGWMTSAMAQPGRGHRGPGRIPQGGMMGEFHRNDSLFAQYKLTDEQREKVGQLRKQHQEEMKKLRKEMQQKQEVFKMEMGKILSPEQMRFMQMHRRQAGCNCRMAQPPMAPPPMDRRRHYRR